MENKLKKKYFDNFAAGWNAYLGPRQIRDEESVKTINCDFKSKGGIGNRDGYDQCGAVADSRTIIRGMASLDTASVHQLIKFADNGSNVELYHSPGTVAGSWTEVATTFTTGLDMHSVQAGNAVYVGNGTDAMKHWDGTNWNATTNGKALKYLEYYNSRIWGVDPSVPDKLWFSGQTTAESWATATKLGDFTDATAGYIIIKPGSGTEIVGLKTFKTSLYIFTRNSIYSLVPASAANTFTVSLVTNAIGCVSHRSIAQVEEDLFFAADDGVYSLGDVANYTAVRTTNKSAKIQSIFNSLSSANKGKLVGKYYNFKYHLFYSLFGTSNDSCVVYDIRYKGWLDWRNMPCADATKMTDSDNNINLYFGTPTTGAVYMMYTGVDDDGSAISTTWESKSFDMDESDVTKLFMDTTFNFGAMNGSVSLSLVFNDSQVLKTTSVSQARPMGGLGRDVLGKKVLGSATNTVTVTNYVGLPLRISARKQKFAIQYRVVSSGSWRLDSISQTYIEFPHYKFPSYLKLT